MKIIITEKPSVAADFAKALGASRADGYFKSNDYIITFCYGHLLALCEPEDYNESFKTWSIESLPIIPETFISKPIPATKKQLSTIEKLLRNKYEELILATDAGREGELIGREVLKYSKVSDFSRVKRFWSSEALTPEVISQGLSKLKSIKEYDKLYASGLHRQLSDWTVGINFSRFFSCSMKDNFSFGRVQSAVLYLIVNRQRKIDSFVPEPYFQLIGRFSKIGKCFKGIYEHNNEDKFKNREDLNNLLDTIRNSEFGSVVSLTKETKKKSPPPLFNLTALQKEANKKYGFSADKTLSICQTLYETHKCLSYPRTPSKVLGTNNVTLVIEKINILSGKYPECFPDLVPSLVALTNKRVFNDEQLEDHHALIPLAVLPQSCSEDERNIYFLVLRSFSAAFHPNYEYESIKAVIDVNGVKFIASGRSILKLGWKEIFKPEKDPNSEEENSESLPPLSVNETVKFEGANIEEKVTTPPPQFNEAELLSAMENPGKYRADESTSFKKDIGLGTQATRAAIIETLLHRLYIVREKKNLVPTKKAFHFIAAIEKYDLIKSFIEVDETAKWEQFLDENPTSFFFNILDFVKRCINELKKTPFENYVKDRTELGKCPICGSPVFEYPKNYSCSAYKTAGCKFTVWKDICGVIVSKTMLKKLLSGKQTEPKTFKTKAEKIFSARLALDKEHKVAFAKE